MRKHTINTLIYTSIMCLSYSTAVMSDEMNSNATGGSALSAGSTSSFKKLSNAKETVQEAAQVVQQLKSDPRTKDVLGQAKAVFIVPNYGRASLGVGGAGGQGVLVANNDGTWSAPAFYNIGAVNAGLQAGVEAGSIAFLVMSDKALEGFRKENNFSLNADAGLTIVNFSKRGQISAGRGADIIVWTGTKGLYGDLAVNVTDIFWDNDANRAYYQQTVDASDIINGTVKEPIAESPLKSEFSALEFRSSPNANSPSRSSPTGSPLDNTPSGDQEEQY